MKEVYFMDTCVLLHILEVPGRSETQKTNLYTEKLINISLRGNTLIIIPLSVVIETGNHINHISDYTKKMDCVNKFMDILNKVKTKEAPWVIYGYDYNEERIEKVIDKYTSLVVSNTGMGDVFILEAFETYVEATPKKILGKVEIWTEDHHLSSYSIQLSDFTR